jgi:hypothetical protein
VDWEKHYNKQADLYNELLESYVDIVKENERLKQERLTIECDWGYDKFYSDKCDKWELAE